MKAALARVDLFLWVVQRATAFILAPLVLVHLVVIVYATRQGLSAEAILGRTEGSFLWAVFYGLFVIAAVVHGTIGLRAILAEVFRLDGMGTNVALFCFAVFAIGIGLRAVAIVT